MKRLLAISAILATGLSAQAQTVLIDTFDVPVGTAGETNLQSNITARQDGSAISATYTNVSSISGPAATQTYLTQTEAYETNGVLNMRSLCNGDGSLSIAASSIAINEDLSASLAGKHYSISYTGVMVDRLGNISSNSPSLDSWYQSITLGGGAGLPNEPTNANNDLGLMMRSDGTAQIWGDSILLGSVVVSNFSILEPYTVYLDINESNSTVKASVICAGIATGLPLAPITFEAGETARRIQFMNRLFVIDFNDPEDWDAFADAQVNDLQIELITTRTIEDLLSTDTFDNGGVMGAEDALNLNQAARQLGSTIPLTYTATGATTASAADQSLLLGDQLLLRNLSDGGTAGSAQAANAGALIDQDLYSSLAGNHYTISYTGQMSSGGVTAGLAAWYQSVTVGGGAGAPDLPEFADADIGFAMRHDGAALLYVDGVFTSWALVDGFAYDKPYNLTVDIDEVTGTAFATVDVEGVLTTVPSVSFSFDAETSRRVQFQNRLVTDTALPNIGGWDILADAYVNDLQMKIIREKNYETWVLVDTGLTLGVNDALTDDAEEGGGDGMNNLLEYALGSNPLVNDAAFYLPKLSTPNATTVNYVYRRRSDAAERGLTYDVLLNTAGLTSSWSNVSNSLETASAPINSDFDSVTNELDITGLSMSFFNLEVTGE